MKHPRNSKEAAKVIQSNARIAVIILAVLMFAIVILKGMYDFIDLALLIALLAFGAAMFGMSISAYASSYQLEFGNSRGPDDE